MKKQNGTGTQREDGIFYRKKLGEASLRNLFEQSWTTDEYQIFKYLGKNVLDKENSTMYIPQQEWAWCTKNQEA